MYLICSLKQGSWDQSRAILSWFPMCNSLKKACHLKIQKDIDDWLESLIISQSLVQIFECNADWAGSKDDRRSTSGYCVFVGGNLVSWKSKKQNVVSRSSAESEYRAMAQSAYEIIWIHHLLNEIGLKTPMPAQLWCDNQAAIHIANNP
ncbi:unnamed protein product, partial [Cuscuta europaea]